MEGGDGVPPAVSPHGFSNQVQTPRFPELVSPPLLPPVLSVEVLCFRETDADTDWLGLLQGVLEESRVAHGNVKNRVTPDLGERIPEVGRVGVSGGGSEALLAWHCLHGERS